MAEVDVQKRIRALRKKLGQIDKLKEKSDLTPEEQAKVNTEPELLAEVTALERGEEYQPAPAPAEPPAEEAPAVEEAAPEAAEEQPGAEVEEQPPEEPAKPEVVLSPDEAEKRIKTLNKKLGQIQKLKDRGTKLCPEEEGKVAQEKGFQAEVMELSISLLDPEAQKTAKALQKKLDQISKLKERKDRSSLSSAEREKITKGPALKQELEGLLTSRK